MIDWAAFSNREHGIVFRALGELHADLHKDLSSAIQHEPTRTPGLFAACHHITQEMHRGNDDLARRDVDMSHILALQTNGDTR